MFAVILCGGDAFLRSYHTDGKVYASAREYLSFMKYVVLLLPLNELLDGMIFADGDEQISLAANTAKGLVKVALSVVLCRTMGTKGLALASLIGFLISILISSVHFFRPGNTLKPNLAFSPPILREILKYGIVDASAHLFVSLFTIAVNFFVTKHFGAEMLIFVSVITLLKETQILFEGIGEAITPIISVYLGEGNCPGVREVWKYAQWSLWIESLFSTLLLLVGAPLIAVYLGIRDPAIVQHAVWGLRALSLTQIFTCRLFLDSSYFILVEKIPLGVFDSFLRDIFPALPLAVIGGLLFGVRGMFVALTLAPPIGYLLSVLYIQRRYGRENYPLFLAETERRKHVELYAFRVLPDEVVKVRDQMGLALRERSCPDRQVSMAMLLFEELFMLIQDCNPGKTVLAECAVEAGESIHLITKDNGRIIDLTDTDRDVSSLRSYTLFSLLETKTTLRVHCLALSYSHNALVIR